MEKFPTYPSLLSFCILIFFLVLVGSGVWSKDAIELGSIDTICRVDGMETDMRSNFIEIHRIPSLAHISAIV